MREISHTYEENKLCLRLSGEVDHHSAGELRREADRLICLYRPKEVLLDLSQIDFMDSSGLGLILGRLARSESIGASFAVLDPAPRVERILTMAGSEKIIAVKKTNGKTPEYSLGKDTKK